MELNKCSREDHISDLHDSIIDCILTKLPIRNAVQTSILSTKWRYQWVNMTQLVFNEDCVLTPFGRSINAKKLFNFIIRCLFLHGGPINKFEISTLYWDKYHELDQCLLYLSRKEIKELVLDTLFFQSLVSLPSAIFSCQQLTSLTLAGFKGKSPLKFQGFPYLKDLYIRRCRFTSEVVENLISGCPLLENLQLCNADDITLGLTIRAPNLKLLTLFGSFKHVYIEHAPLLVSICLDVDLKDFESNIPVRLPVECHSLKSMELIDINFEEMIDVFYVLHLILQSPSLQELIIKAFQTSVVFKTADMNFWEKECPTDCTFKQLKRVILSDVSSINHMDFIKFVLRRCPVLEMMGVWHADYLDQGYLINPEIEGAPVNSCRAKKKFENKVLRFERASSKIDINFENRM